MAYEIKKTMIDALAFVKEKGKMTAEDLELFTTQFCIKSSRSTDAKPREITKLFDAAGELLGGRCSATKLWFKLSDFNHHHGLSKQAQNVKSRNNTVAKGMEVEASKLLEDARELTEPDEKLAAFEAYDVAMGEAKAVREATITPDEFTTEVDTFETIGELAEFLNVDVISTKPAKTTEPEGV